MPVYQPFLLPLLNETKAPPAVGGPLEEEHLIEEQRTRFPSIWSSLAERVRVAYGVGLMISLADGDISRSNEEGLQAPPYGRYIELRRGCETVFLIEHPEGIRQFDHAGTADQLLAIAKPSLFASLLHRVEDASMPAPDPAAPPDAGTVPALSAFLESLLLRRPSDWHLEPERNGYRSRVRIHGILTPPESLSRARGDWLADSLIARCGMGNQAAGTPLEGRSRHALPSGENVAFRASFTPALHGYSLALRFLYEDHAEAPSFGGFGLDPGQARWLLREYTRKEGLWLLAGPTGSGKTTTLHRLLSASVALNEKVLAIEDPVERVLPGVHHLNVNSPPGLDFAHALKAFLRQAPDCILIGEIRDRETAEMALQAARTGHRILSTLHARDNRGVLRRFADLGQPPASLTALNPVVLHQRLLPSLCPRCRRRQPLPEAWKAPLRDLRLPIPEVTARPEGCDQCRDGIGGRQAIFSSGHFSPGVDSSHELLASGWNLLLNQEVPFSSVQPLMPARARAAFGFATGKHSVKRPELKPSSLIPPSRNKNLVHP